MLSPQVQEWISKAQIVSFERWNLADDSVAMKVFRQANQERRYLTDADFAILAETQEKQWLEAAMVLRDRAAEIVDRARAQVLAAFPNITAPGGALYPEKRAENCWRDFWHFLRCIHYGIAGKTPEYTSAEGLYYMDLLYQELQVPLEAMVLGLEAVKQFSITSCTWGEKEQLFPYFDHLISQLKKFQGDVNGEISLFF